jgi:hypothetical protein
MHQTQISETPSPPLIKAAKFVTEEISYYHEYTVRLQGHYVPVPWAQ